jgi:hypothetical protein
VTASYTWVPLLLRSPGWTMARYVVMRIGSRFYRAHSSHDDPMRAVDDYTNLVARTDAALVRVGEPAPDDIAVLAAGGADPKALANDSVFMDAVRRAAE